MKIIGKGTSFVPSRSKIDAVISATQIELGERSGVRPVAGRQDAIGTNQDKPFRCWDVRKAGLALLLIVSGSSLALFLINSFQKEESKVPEGCLINSSGPFQLQERPSSCFKLLPSHTQDECHLVYVGDDRLCQPDLNLEGAHHNCSDGGIEAACRLDSLPESIPSNMTARLNSVAPFGENSGVTDINVTLAGYDVDRYDRVVPYLVTPKGLIPFGTQAPRELCHGKWPVDVGHYVYDLKETGCNEKTVNIPFIVNLERDYGKMPIDPNTCSPMEEVWDHPEGHHFGHLHWWDQLNHDPEWMPKTDAAGAYTLGQDLLAQSTGFFLLPIPKGKILKPEDIATGNANSGSIGPPLLKIAKDLRVPLTDIVLVKRPLQEKLDSQLWFDWHFNPNDGSFQPYVVEGLDEGKKNPSVFKFKGCPSDVLTLAETKGVMKNRYYPDATPIDLSPANGPFFSQLITASNNCTSHLTMSPGSEVEKASSAELTFRPEEDNSGGAYLLGRDRLKFEASACFRISDLLNDQVAAPMFFYDVLGRSLSNPGVDGLWKNPLTKRVECGDTISSDEDCCYGNDHGEHDIECGPGITGNRLPDGQSKTNGSISCHFTPQPTEHAGRHKLHFNINSNQWYTGYITQNYISEGTTRVTYKVDKGCYNTEETTSVVEHAYEDPLVSRAQFKMPHLKSNLWTYNPVGLYTQGEPGVMDLAYIRYTASPV